MTPRTWSEFRLEFMAECVSGTVFECRLCHSTDSQIILEISGKGAKELLGNEQGGHRWQRIPPTERKGRVHTSTITVAVMEEASSSSVKLIDAELEISTCRGSGAGGQHRNKTDSAVQIKHIPTGLIVRCESERSQLQNKETAKEILRSRIEELSFSKNSSERADNRKNQVGSGQRGDKRRTIRQQDNQVVDHVSGRVWRYDDYQRGIW